MPTSLQKPFLLFATPRSGSWPVCETLLEYLKQTKQVEGLGEPFNTHAGSVTRSGGKVVWTYFPHYLTTEDRMRTYGSPGAVEMHSHVVDQRLELIVAEAGKYFFKVFPNQVSPTHLVQLARHFEMIFLERESRWEQLLSFMISVQTNQWYEEGGVRWAEKSIRAERVHFDSFENILMMYSLVRRQHRPAHVVTYEQFLSLGPKGILEALGLREPVDLSRLVLKPKQNPPDKERAFSNLAELRSWFESSSLARPESRN